MMDLILGIVIYINTIIFKQVDWNYFPKNNELIEYSQDQYKNILNFFQVFLCIVMAALYIKKFEKLFNETKNIKFLRFILYLSFFLISSPIIYTSFYKRIQENEIKYNLVYWSKWFDNTVIHTFYIITLIYILKYINQSGNYSNFFELLIIFPYFGGLLYGLFEGLFVVTDNVRTPFLANVIILVAYIGIIFYKNWNSDIKKLLGQLLFIGYNITCQYALYQENYIFYYGYLVQLNNSGFISIKILKYVYIVLFFGYTFQVILTTYILQNIVKKNLRIKYLAYSLQLEWVYLTYFYWVNHFIKKNTIYTKTEDYDIFEYNIGKNYYSYQIILTIILAGHNVFGIFFYVIQYIEIIIYQKLNKYIIFQYILLFSGIIELIRINELKQTFFLKNEILMIIIFQCIFPLYLYTFNRNKIKTIGSKKFECVICYEKTYRLKVFLRCGHNICFSCFGNRYWSNCPICRNPVISIKDYHGQYCIKHEYSGVSYSREHEGYICAKCTPYITEKFQIFGIE